MSITLLLLGWDDDKPKRRESLPRDFLETPAPVRATPMARSGRSRVSGRSAAQTPARAADQANSGLGFYLDDTGWPVLVARREVRP